MFEPDHGTALAVEELCREIIAEPEVEGVTFLGGEPFEQAAALAALATQVREARLSVMTFTGHSIESLRASPSPAVAALLDATDLLADGPFEARYPGSRWPWLGSQNQRLHFLSDRYRSTDPAFAASNTVELRLSAAGLEVTGWAPAVLRIERGLKRARSGTPR